MNDSHAETSLLEDVRVNFGGAELPLLLYLKLKVELQVGLFLTHPQELSTVIFCFYSVFLTTTRNIKHSDERRRIGDKSMVILCAGMRER